MYDPVANNWTEVANNAPTFTKCSAVAHRDTIYVCGYNSGSPAHCIIFTPTNNTWTYIDAPYDLAVC